jgi:hypothetical protein
MNSYEPPAPRVASVLSAIAMAAITVSALVVLPAKFDFAGADLSSLTAAEAATIAPIDVAIGLACIKVPAMVGPEENLQLGPQALRGKRHKSSSRDPANT